MHIQRKAVRLRSRHGETDTPAPLAAVGETTISGHGVAVYLCKRQIGLIHRVK